MNKECRYIEQIQRWTGGTRHLILIETPGGTASIQLELYHEPQEWDDFKGTAFLWGLWVDESIRRKGYANRLMEIAEEIARNHGHKDVYLEWSIKDSSIEIFQWYERRGYDEKAFSTGENCKSLMMKSLVPIDTPKKQ